MAQLFLRRADTFVRAAFVGIFLFLAVAGGLTYALWWSPYMTRVGVVIDQPVPFSHQHHVGGLGIDCRYCHGTVETSPSAGMPATDTCMACHSQVWTDAPVLEPVRESSRLGIPIQWTRVYDLPGYTYFDHSIHVQKGVACATCHGAVEEMPLTYRARDLYMKTCLECHRRPEGYHQSLDDGRQQDAAGAAPEEPPLAGRALESRAVQLTDCSICHR